MITFLTGASGSGKTTLARELECSGAFSVYFFDSVGVPSAEEMKERFGSVENWQRSTTLQWIERLDSDHGREESVLLEGQANMDFIAEAFERSGVEGRIVLVDCEDEIRGQRLIDRGQPELANEDMMNWARFLRRQAIDRDIVILETSGRSVEESSRQLLSYFI